MGEQNWYAVHDLINFFFIIWKKIIAVIDATPLQLRKESLKNCAHNCDDLLSYYSSPRSSHIWFPYIHNFIIILLQVYNEPIQRPAPSWIVSSDGRALHRYRRGKGSESRTSLNFFFFSRLVFATSKVASITAIIFFHIILHPVVLMYDFHIFITSFLLLLNQNFFAVRRRENFKSGISGRLEWRHVMKLRSTEETVSLN